MTGRFSDVLDVGDGGLVNCSISHPKKPSEEAVADAKNQRKRWFLSKSRIVGFQVLRNDIVPVRKAWQSNVPENPGERGQIEFLSSKSLRRLSLIANNTPVDFRSFLTLTYPAAFPSDGKLVKRHLNLVLTAIRKRFPGMEYLWFLEFQKRGAPHVHIFLDISLPFPLEKMKRRSGRRVKEVRVNWELQDWISERWYSIVGSGDEKHLRAGAAWEVVEKRDGMARYVAKEAYKTFQKHVPKGYQDVGRFWGTSRGVPPEMPEVIPANLEQLKAFMPAECFGEEEQPFPICYGAADAYRKIIGTSVDPDKIHECKIWNRGKLQKELSSGELLKSCVSRKPIAPHDQD